MSSHTQPTVTKPTEETHAPSPVSRPQLTTIFASKKPARATSSAPSYHEKPAGDHITIDVAPPMETHAEHDDIKPINEIEEEKEHEPLHIFHSALGIPPPKPVKPSMFKKKSTSPKDHRKITAANQGVYKKVLSCERWSRYQYYFCSFVVTFGMFLQIVVGAAVTAFGAGQASHILITVFGAANTALASLLAVLKSQGLPNRIRQDWNGWRELREYIEDQERSIDLIVSGKVEGRKEDLNVWEKVRAIEARYNAVRLTAEANRPDTYIKVPVPSLPR